MPLPKTFIHAWYIWIHTCAPYENARLKRHQVPTYEIEIELDHLDSFLYRIGQDIINRKDIDFSQAAQAELVRLRSYQAAIEKCEMNEKRQEIFRKYFDDTKNLLEEVIKLGSSVSLA